MDWVVPCDVDTTIKVGKCNDVIGEKDMGGEWDWSLRRKATGRREGLFVLAEVVH